MNMNCLKTLAFVCLVASCVYSQGCSEGQLVLQIDDSTSKCIDEKMCTTDTDMYVLDGTECVSECPAGYKTVKDTSNTEFSIMLCVSSISGSSTTAGGTQKVSSFDNGDELVKPCNRVLEDDESEACYLDICPLGSLFDGKGTCYAETAQYSISGFSMTGSGDCEAGGQVGTLPQCSKNDDDFTVKYTMPSFFDEEGFSKRWSGELVLKFTVYKGTTLYTSTTLPSGYLVKFIFLSKENNGRTLDFTSFITSVSFAERYIKIKQEATMFSGLGRSYRIMALFIKLKGDLDAEEQTNLLNSIRPIFDSKDPRNEYRYAASEMNTIDKSLTSSNNGVYDESQLDCFVEGCLKCSSTNSNYCESCDSKEYFTVKGACIEFSTTFEQAKSTIEKECSVVGCEKCIEGEILKCAECKGTLELNDKSQCVSTEDGSAVDPTTGASYCQAPNCKECDPFDSNKCKTCASGFSKSSSGDCVSGTFENGYECSKDPACTDCDDDDEACLVCDITKAILKSGKCIPSDTTGTVVSSCATDTGCADCDTTTGTCAECATDYIKYGNKCILETIASGTYQCKAGEQGCSVCNTAGDSCKICAEGFVANGKACEVNTQDEDLFECIKEIPGCKTCNDDITACEVCLDGYELSGEACTKKSTTGDITCKIEKCQTCSQVSADICTTCEPGYKFDSQSKKCVCNVEFCSVCTSESVCTECLDGFELDDQKNCAKICANKLCARCEADEITKEEVCLNCVAGYILLDEGCTDECLYCNEDCDYENEVSCETCMPGYKMLFLPAEQGDSSQQSGTGSSDPSSGGDSNTGDPMNGSGANGYCAECETGNCLSCYDESDGSEICELCIDGYALVGGVCELCADQECMMCSSSDLGICIQCNPGYYVNYDRYSSSSSSDHYGECFECSDSNCLECPEKGNYCDLCADGFAIEEGNSNYCVETPFNPDTCQIFMRSRSSSDSPNCYQCKGQRFLSENTCIDCPFNHCSYCSFSTCTYCEYGYTFDKLANDCIEIPPRRILQDSGSSGQEGAGSQAPEGFGKSTAEVDYTEDDYKEKLEALGMQTTPSKEDVVTKETFPISEVEYSFSGTSCWFREKLVIIAEPSFYPEEVEAMTDYINIDLGMDLSSSYDYSLTCDQTGTIISSGGYKRILNITIPADIDVSTDCDIIVTVTNDYNKIEYSLTGLVLNPPSQESMDDAKDKILKGEVSTEDMGSYGATVSSVISNMVGGADKISEMAQEARQINNKDVDCEDYCVNGTCEDNKCVCQEGYAPPTCKNTTAEMDAQREVIKSYATTVLSKLDEATDEEIAEAGSLVSESLAFNPDAELAGQSEEILSYLADSIGEGGSASLDSSEILNMIENHAAGSVSASVPEKTLVMGKVLENMVSQTILESGCDDLETKTDDTMVKLYVLETSGDLESKYEFTLDSQTFLVTFSEAFVNSIASFMNENPESVAFYFVLTPVGTIYPEDTDLIPTGGTLTIKLYTCSGDNIADDIFYDDTVEVYIEMPLDEDYADEYAPDVTASTNETTSTSTDAGARFLQDVESTNATDTQENSTNATAADSQANSSNQTAISTQTYLRPKICRVDTTTGICEMMDSQSNSTNGYISFTINSNSVYLTVSEEETVETEDGVTQYTNTTTTNGSVLMLAVSLFVFVASSLLMLI